ncbi:RCC1-like G exchanging factor-like protein [Ciona intestinalis]
MFRRSLVILHHNTRCYYKAPVKINSNAEKKLEHLPIHRFVGKSRKRYKQLHVCGLTVTGALGLPDIVVSDGLKPPVLHQPYPHKIILDGISSFDCGYGFSIFCGNQSGSKVWACGINTDSQIGFHKYQDEKDEEMPNNQYYNYVMKPLPLPLPLKEKSSKVLDVSCGRAHSVILTDEAIFAVGNNAFGQCGRRIIDGEIYEGSQKINRIPHKHFGSKVVKILCGMDHTMFLTEDGRVFTCGWGADGQTGLGKFECTGIPTEVKGDLEGVKITQLTTFSDTSLALSDEHEVYGWGNSEYDQLGCVTESTQLTCPKKLPFKLPSKVVQVAAGGTAFLLLDQNGDVYVWGHGILGKGPNLETTSWPTKIPGTLFGKNEFNLDVEVVSITCGLGHFAAVTNKGELFTWGKNRNGCLGIGTHSDQYFPWKVLIGADIQKVSCGVDHMIVMSKTFL